MLNVLIACEESQTVCTAFRELGHRAFSCDLQECSGGHPEWHVVGDCVPLLNGRCDFTTTDGKLHQQADRWDLVIAHPPCTYMSKAGARWMYPKAGELSQERLALAMQAKDFFYTCYNADCEYVAVENPRPLAIVGLPNPSTVIQPYDFGEPYSKATYLWLRNLPPLMSTCCIANHRPYLPSNTGGKKKGQKYSFGISKNQKESSKTFRGVALAMASQWSSFIEDEKNPLHPTATPAKITRKEKEQ